MLWGVIISLFTFSGVIAQEETKVAKSDTILTADSVSDMAVDKNFAVKEYTPPINENVRNIENNLTRFYKANRTSQFLLIGGSIVASVGVAMIQNDPARRPNYLPLIGCVSTIFG